MSPVAAQYALDMVETLRQVEAQVAKNVKVDDPMAPAPNRKSWPNPRAQAVASGYI